MKFLVRDELAFVVTNAIAALVDELSRELGAAERKGSVEVPAHALTRDGQMERGDSWVGIDLPAEIDWRDVAVARPDPRGSESAAAQIAAVLHELNPGGHEYVESPFTTEDGREEVWDYVRTVVLSEP